MRHILGDCVGTRRSGRGRLRHICCKLVDSVHFIIMVVQLGPVKYIIVQPRDCMLKQLLYIGNAQKYYLL